MKAIAKQHPIPLKLTLEFETLEELQAFEMIFHVSAIVEAMHLDTDVISEALPGSFSDEQLDEFIADIERHFA